MHAYGLLASLQIKNYKRGFFFIKVLIKKNPACPLMVSLLSLILRNLKDSN